MVLKGPKLKGLERDVRDLEALKRQGAIKDYDYQVNGRDDWLAIYGIPLPQGKFNFPDFNMKLPIPHKLYEASGHGKHHFYDAIFIDSQLRRVTPQGLEPIARQIIGMYPEELSKGWAYLCVIPHPSSSKETTIAAVIAIAQGWIINNGK